MELRGSNIESQLALWFSYRVLIVVAFLCVFSPTMLDAASDCSVTGNGQTAVDCAGIYSLGGRKNGVYTIYPQSSINPLQVYCDMNTDGGGWTVIQRRGDFVPQTDFYQDWEAYKNGFGSVERDFWLGNENIYTISNQGEYSLRVDMRDHYGGYNYSLHNTFRISDEISQYRLYVDGYRGTVADDLSSHNNQKFWTKDRTDYQRGANVEQCTSMYHGAFWYISYNCGYVNLNGLYRFDNNGDRHSNWWWDWTGYQGLEFSEMKIRPKSFKA